MHEQQLKMRLYEGLPVYILASEFEYLNGVVHPFDQGMFTPLTVTHRKDSRIHVASCRGQVTLRLSDVLRYRMDGKINLIKGPDYFDDDPFRQVIARTRLGQKILVEDDGSLDLADTDARFLGFLGLVVVLYDPQEYGKICKIIVRSGACNQPHLADALEQELLPRFALHPSNIFFNVHRRQQIEEDRAVRARAREEQERYCAEFALASVSVQPTKMEEEDTQSESELKVPESETAEQAATETDPVQKDIGEIPDTTLVVQKIIQEGMSVQVGPHTFIPHQGHLYLNVVSKKTLVDPAKAQRKGWFRELALR